MKYHVLTLSGTALLASALAWQFSTNNLPQSVTDQPQAGLGDAAALETLYNQWAKSRSEIGDNESLTLALGYSKALSVDFTEARGSARIDLVDGSVSVEVSGLAGDEAYDVWLIDNRPGPGRSVRPEAGDEMLRLGTLEPKTGGHALSVGLADRGLQGFEIDLVAVARTGQSVQDAGLLFGSPSLFQKLYHHDREGWYASLAGGIRDGGDTARAPLDFLVPRAAFAQNTSVNMAALVSRGERLFFEETFRGNGRTCGTCHPAENNLTIDPPFIATLPKDDPLFVAEFNPDLKTLERPKLMRELGLILENLDGFDDLENKFTMRGVPHTLALPTSLEPSNDGTVTPPFERTGWSGDGSPGGGTLREFAIGAVTQHFPRTLEREPGKDFRLPNDQELDAMEAFQLSLGRQEDIVLEDLVFLDRQVARGQAIFLNQTAPNPNPEIGFGQCARCHANAGANINFADMNNRNFNTGVELLTDGAARLLDQTVPCDGGFGREPSMDADAICSLEGAGFVAFGDGSFNTTPLIEAADTPPFFHNNAVATIEGAVAFYSGPEFNQTGIAQAIGGIALTEDENLAVAAMLRVLNSLDNIRSATASERQALEPANRGRKQTEKLLGIAIAENQDAAIVLRERELHPDAVRDLGEADALLQEAFRTRGFAHRKRLILEAIDLQEAAREDMVMGG